MRVLILNSAPGIALRRTLSAWQRLNPLITFNNYGLPKDDIDYLSRCGIKQITFNPRDPDALHNHCVAANGFSIITSRLNVPLRQNLLMKLSATALQEPLKILGQSGSSTAHIDHAAAERLGIRIVNAAGANANAVAEFTLAQLLCLVRKLNTYNQLSHGQVWSKQHFPPQAELHELCLGLVGYGHVARALASKAQALGLSVLVYTRHPERIETSYAIADSLDILLQQADCVSLHVPYNADTHHLIAAREIALMKPGAFLLNTARGQIIDEQALADDLASQQPHLGGVALDVFAREGDVFSSPLCGCQHALLTPHVAGTTNKALTDTAVSLVDNILSLLEQIDLMPMPSAKL